MALYIYKGLGLLLTGSLFFLTGFLWLGVIIKWVQSPADPWDIFILCLTGFFLVALSHAMWVVVHMKHCHEPSVYLTYNPGGGQYVTVQNSQR